jgi:uncharacterized protein
MQAQEAIEESISFFGHKNVRATHRNTIEITKDSELSERGNCIIGVRASKACSDLSEPLRRHIRSGGFLSFKIVVSDKCFSFSGRGDPALTLSHHEELVLRKSDFESERTLAVRCSAASIDIPRSIAESLTNPSTEGKLIIRARADTEPDFEWTLP